MTKISTLDIGWNDIDDYLNQCSMNARWLSEFIKLDLDADALSKCQLLSKYYLAKHLPSSVSSVAIAGCWYGQLAQILSQEQKGKDYTGIDIDGSLEPVATKLNRNIDYYHVTCDMFDYAYNFYDCVINTSCEHVEAIENWLCIIPSGTTVALQSNNFYAGTGHVSCVETKEKFSEQVCDYVNIDFLGAVTMPLYSRFTIIGKIK